MADPPPYQEAAQCSVCNCNFTTFKRRHHCRCCGRSLCSDHSTNQKALPQFGIYSPVRVCDNCYNPTPPQIKPKPSIQAVSKAVDGLSTSIDKLNLAKDSSFVDKEVEDEAPAPPATPAFDCTCGMPLCICTAPTPEVVLPSQPQPAIPVKPKRSPLAANNDSSSLSTGSSYGNTMPSLFFQIGQTSQRSSHPLSKSYELTGEGLREAVKNGDVAAVKDLLSQGLDANYFDKQGMSLLHLAAMFNFTEITFMLMDAGANVQAKNAQGETPIDCAQTTLGHKMRQRLDSTIVT
ncbi:hypothetical protein BDL97_08G050300 [Sphagnum fallax]|nr:hypothetical protein BDL97_08G050300 [Sphagnum fallax]